MKRLLFFCIVGILAGVHFQAFAQVGTGRKNVKLNITPGETISDSLTVTNYSDANATVRVYFQDLNYPAPFDGTREFLPLNSTPRSFGKWISIFPEELKLSPRGKEELTYSIKVPEDAKGGYYGILFLENSPTAVKAGLGVGIITRIGCPFLLETHDKEKRAEIEDISVASDTIHGNFSNVGNVLLISTGSFYVMNEQDMVVDRGEIGKRKFHLLLERKAPFTVNLSKKLPQGSYTLLINFDLGEGNIALKEFDFSKDSAGDIKILQVKD